MDSKNVSETKDIYRDSLLRYLGYSNEVGEAFRGLINRKLVHASYAVAIGYVCADAGDKSYKKYKSNAPSSQIAIVASDVFIWQMLASVIIPGYTINRITYFSRYFLKRIKVQKPFREYLPTGIGLAAIPLIVHPIDTFIDYLMDNTYRKLLKSDL